MSVSSASSDPFLRLEWVRTAIDRCQIAVADEMDSSRDHCWLAGRAFIDQAPAPVTRFESLILRGLVAEVMLRRAIELHLLSNECVAVLNTARLQRPLELMAQKRLRHPTVVRAIALIRRSYTNPNLRLTDVATAVGVTACHLSHLLRDETGAGFVEHVQMCRLRSAQRLFKQPLSLKQIASEVGYRRAADLTRHFKASCGMPPTTWRRRHSSGSHTLNQTST